MKRILIAGRMHRTSPTRAPAPSPVPKGDKLDLKSLLKGNGIFLLLGASLLIGMLIGALAARGAEYETLERLDFLFSSNFMARRTQSRFCTFTASLASSFLFVLVCFLMGLSLWGAFLVPLVPLFRGYGMGFSAGYLYAFYGFRGVSFYFLVLLPGFFLSALAIIICARESIRFSSVLVASGRSEAKQGKLLGSLRLYFMRTGMILIVLFASAVVDVLLTACFSGLIEF